MYSEVEIIKAAKYKIVAFEFPELKAQWENAKAFIEANFDERVWNGLRSSSPQGIIVTVDAIKSMPELTGTEKQIAYAKSLRMQKMAHVASMIAEDERVGEFLAEMGKETSSKAWIEIDAMEMAEKAAENLPEA